MNFAGPISGTMRTDAARVNAVTVTAQTSGEIAPRTPVWDLGVRAFHWTLVCCVAGALATGFLAPRWWLDIHVILGATTAALILFRIVWGFLGPTYARFASFVVSPIAALRHAIALLRDSAPHHLGHNPVGAMMIVALIAALGVLVASGVATLGGALKEGPFAPVASYAVGDAAKGIHSVVAWALIVLIAGHLCGVALESLRTKENLVRSMIRGDKRVRAHAIASPRVRARPRRAVFVLAVAAALLGPAASAMSYLPARNVPLTSLDPVYAKECAACHSVHHPSLASATVWRSIIDGLSEHFGDDASLDAKQVERLRAYLTANSAEVWDTKAANVMRVPDPAGSLRITRTAGWNSIHHRVAPGAFAAETVNGKHNCAACHADATSGQFAARSISLPKERKLP